jgi:type II secretory pathway component GspD/PulD (secretin)
MVNNNGSQFVIGGLEKKSIVTNVNKVPWLGDIPGLGWLLGSESPTTKKSQLVAVIECTPVMPETKVPEEVRKEIAAMTEKVVSAGENWKMNEVGFDQYLLDGEKKGIDPLP